jgi:hypothetical protein
MHNAINKRHHDDYEVLAAGTKCCTAAAYSIPLPQVISCTLATLPPAPTALGAAGLDRAPFSYQIIMMLQLEDTPVILM